MGVMCILLTVLISTLFINGGNAQAPATTIGLNATVACPPVSSDADLIDILLTALNEAIDEEFEISASLLVEKLHRQIALSILTDPGFSDATLDEAFIAQIWNSKIAAILTLLIQEHFSSIDLVEQTIINIITSSEYSGLFPECVVNNFLNTYSFDTSILIDNLVSAGAADFPGVILDVASNLGLSISNETSTLLEDTLTFLTSELTNSTATQSAVTTAALNAILADITAASTSGTIAGALPSGGFSDIVMNYIEATFSCIFDGIVGNTIDQAIVDAFDVVIQEIFTRGPLTAAEIDQILLDVLDSNLILSSLTANIENQDITDMILQSLLGVLSSCSADGSVDLATLQQLIQTYVDAELSTVLVDAIMTSTTRAQISDAIARIVGNALLDGSITPETAALLNAGAVIDRIETSLVQVFGVDSFVVSFIESLLTSVVASISSIATNPDLAAAIDNLITTTTGGVTVPSVTTPGGVTVPGVTTPGGVTAPGGGTTPTTTVATDPIKLLSIVKGLLVKKPKLLKGFKAVAGLKKVLTKWVGKKNGLELAGILTNTFSSLVNALDKSTSVPSLKNVVQAFLSDKWIRRTVGVKPAIINTGKLFPLVKVKKPKLLKPTLALKPILPLIKNIKKLFTKSLKIILTE